MTRRRYDDKSTEFGLWLREQPEIDSHLGFIATNIDYLWENYHTGEWMLIEEKRFAAEPTWSQKDQFRRLDAICKADPKYRGFHLLRFQNTSPEDGWIQLDGKLISVEELIAFLRFDNKDT